MQSYREDSFAVWVSPLCKCSALCVVTVAVLSCSRENCKCVCVCVHTCVSVCVCLCLRGGERERKGGNKASWKVKKQMRLLETYCLAAGLHHLFAAANVCVCDRQYLCACMCVFVCV